ncbi:MAG TPA: LLM class flavin-dependent oxidoreductase [Polyangiaceae bacterium]
MKLYVTFTSPYARLARIVVAEKGFADRVEIIEAKTRTAGSPYYRINPSGRVPYLIDDAGVAMEDSQVICAYLDGLDGKPRLHPSSDADWSYRRLEARACCGMGGASGPLTCQAEGSPSRRPKQGRIKSAAEWRRWHRSRSRLAAMELGIHIVNFTVPGAPSTIAAAVGDMVAAAEDIGVTHISVMDHWFQMEMMGSAAMEMLESYTTLGYIAARTKKARLGVLVTGVTYRHPGLLAKIVTSPCRARSRSRIPRSSSAAGEKRRRCGSSPSTPTPATSSRSSDPTECVTSSTSSAGTARRSGATTRRSRRPSSPWARRRAATAATS